MSYDITLKKMKECGLESLKVILYMSKLLLKNSLLFSRLFDIRGRESETKDEMEDQPSETLLTRYIDSWHLCQAS